MMRLQLLNSVENVSSGDAKAKDGFHSIQMRNCQNPSTIAIASSLGQAALQTRLPSEHFGATGTSSASRPAVSARSSTAMAPHLVLEPVGDDPRAIGDVERVEAPRPLD